MALLPALRTFFHPITWAWVILALTTIGLVPLWRGSFPLPLLGLLLVIALILCICMSLIYGACYVVDLIKNKQKKSENKATFNRVIVVKNLLLFSLVLLIFFMPFHIFLLCELVLLRGLSIIPGITPWLGLSLILLHRIILIFIVFASFFRLFHFLWAAYKKGAAKFC